ncbi:hypothetical protein OSB04_012849, partial [Centaurea solstitialis]
MENDIDLNGMELFEEDIEDADMVLDDAEVDLHEINMDENQQDNLEQTTAVPAWRNFKKNLKAEYMEKNRSPCAEFNFIDEKTCRTFCQMKSELEFQALSKINRAHAKENKNPHHLGSRGYQGKYGVWDKEEEQGVTPEIFGMMHKRSRHWLLARRAKGVDETYILEEHTMVVAKEIISYKHGDWDPKLGIDPLVAVLGPEHPGRTRGVGHNVGLRVGLRIEHNMRKNKDNSNSKAEIVELRAQMERDRKEFEERSKLVRKEWEDQAENDATIVESPGLREGSVGSSVCTSHLLSIKHATPCELLSGFKKAKAIVAKGFVFPLENDIVDGARLEEGYIKVRVELVMDGCEGFPLPVPLQNADITKLGDALGSCIQRDQQFLMLQPALTNTNKPVRPNPTSGSNSIPPLITSTKVPPKSASIPHKVQNGEETHSMRETIASEPQSKAQKITKMKPLPKENCMTGLRQRLHCNKEFVKNGVTTHVEAGVFGPSETHIAVKHSDLEDLMTNGWLDQSIITWFLAAIKEYNEVVGPRQADIATQINWKLIK